MKQITGKLKVRLYQICIALILIIALEWLSKGILIHEGKDFPFFINIQSYRDDILSTYDFDPLLGWQWRKSELKRGQSELGETTFSITNKRIQQIGNGDSAGLKILITGGSTSDMVAYPNNWPIHLYHLLEERKLNPTIYVAAVAGYNSGQELLRLIRDGIELEPDIHISYSGANESKSPGYATHDEKQFFENAVNNYGSFLLPNALYLLRKTFRGLFTSSEATLFDPQVQGRDVPYEFWAENMKIMKAISERYGYSFYGILQPVLGVTYQQNYLPLIEEEGLDFITDYLKKHQVFYPKAMHFIPTMNGLYDFTNIFDNESGKVFRDDCHLAESYHQACVAERVLDLLANSTANFDLKSK